ncbi:hypothetical protein ASPFODRAFT_356715 [Aspergillus luchuensis CBS 106.47]|uniref:Uncharacterized protein n=1 Tax=Aspergillus luchuensis (strain CBS 106.47) TaxID=1137211 RepID=A0A1M3T6R2_ASPLC|nr:hypothetical protein ASPFODRAFT_356715 [Aspergillus luchuensis CBS 106.47]
MEWKVLSSMLLQGRALFMDDMFIIPQARWKEKKLKWQSLRQNFLFLISCYFCVFLFSAARERKKKKKKSDTGAWQSNRAEEPK